MPQPLPGSAWLHLPLALLSPALLALACAPAAGLLARHPRLQRWLAGIGLALALALAATWLWPGRGAWAGIAPLLGGLVEARPGLLAAALLLGAASVWREASSGAWSWCGRSALALALPLLHLPLLAAAIPGPEAGVRTRLALLGASLVLSLACFWLPPWALMVAACLGAAWAARGFRRWLGLLTALALALP